MGLYFLCQEDIICKHIGGEGHESFQGNVSYLMVLVGYGSNNNRLSVREKVDWMVYHSAFKHLHQRLLPAIHQLFELEQ